MSHIEPVHDPIGKSEASPTEEFIAEFQLRDGPLVRFRHVRPEDQPLIAESIRTASRETLLHRFFSPVRGVAPDRLRQMLSIDRAKELCLLGVIEGDGATRGICGARYVRLPAPATAEIAVTVHDDFQHRGLGTFVLRLLAQLAVADGIRWFEADVMASNQKMLNLFAKFAPTRRGWQRLGDVYHITIEVAALAP